MSTSRPSAADRRAEERQAASGEVQLCRTNLPGMPFSGRLIDTAQSGFRARHDRFALESGELVAFEFAGRRGVARAMWKRIVGREVETGFRIL